MRTSRWLVATYVAIILFGIVTAFPNLFSQATLATLPGWFSKQHVTLGLDLRGGSHLVLEVDARALVQERVQSLIDEARRALREAGITFTSLQRRDNAIVVNFKNGTQGADAVRALQRLATPVGMRSFGAATTDLKVATVSPEEIRLSLTEEGVRDRVNAAVDQSLEIIRRRIDQVGVAEPTIQRVGADRILVQLPGVQDPGRIRELLGSTAKLSFHMLAAADPSGHPPPGVKVLPAAEGRERYPIEEQVVLAGERLSDARAGFDQRTKQPIVSFRLDHAGARTFAAITEANVGNPFAIVLDGKVLSAPVIREPITGGAGQISGNFTVQQATDLAALLRAGALPAPLTVIEERTVGADLGSDAIQMGMYTGLAVSFWSSALCSFSMERGGSSPISRSR